MTIVTKPLTDKKPEKSLEEPLVSESPLPEKNLEEGTLAHLVIRRRGRAVSTLCVTLTALLVLTAGVIGGIYLFRHFVRAKKFRGWCGVSYYDHPKQDGIVGQPNKQMLSDKHYIEEEVEIDIQFEEYELIEVPKVPDFDNNRRGRFVHDFSLNLTGIVDVDGEQCFILKLNRSLVSPPRNLWEFMQRLSTNYYDVNTEVVRETMQVITPPLTNYDELGFYITRECGLFPTYNLLKVEPKSVHKRRAKEKAMFKVFAGQNPIYYNIIFP